MAWWAGGHRAAEGWQKAGTSEIKTEQCCCAEHLQFMRRKWLRVCVKNNIRKCERSRDPTELCRGVRGSPFPGTFSEGRGTGTLCDKQQGRAEA